MGVGDSIYCILAWSKSNQAKYFATNQPASCYNKTILRHKPTSIVLQQDNTSPQTYQNRVTTRQYFATNLSEPCYNKTILRHKQPASCYNKTIFRHKPISSVLQQDNVSPQTNQNRVTTRQYYATNQPAPCCIIFQNPIRLWFIVVIINRVSVVSD